MFYENDVEIAREFVLTEGLRVHRGYVYPDEVPEIPSGKRVKITVEYEIEGVDYHNAEQE